jgi:hypothetical protein
MRTAGSVLSSPGEIAVGLEPVSVSVSGERGPKTARRPTLPAALARLGVVRRAPRRWLIGASALAITGALVLMVMFGAGADGAGAHPGPARGLSVAGSSPPQGLPPADTQAVAAPATEGLSAAPEQAASRRSGRARRPPEMFRHPGF